MDIVLLCAGTSSRMQGKDKLLLEYRNRSFACISALAALSFLKNSEPHSKLILVTGYRSQEVLSSLAPCFSEAEKNGIEIVSVINENYILGQTSSIKAGVSEVSKDSDFFIALGDMPLIASGHYSFLFRNRDNHDAFRAMVNGVPGHPVLFKYHMKRKIMNLEDSVSVKTLLKSVKTKNLISEDEAYITDCDTPEEYKRLLFLL